MIITLAGSIIGFLSSIIPELINTWNNKNESKTELELLKRQLELEQKYSNNYQNNFKPIETTISTRNLTSIEMFKSSVRPVITYMLFAMFVFNKICIFIYAQDLAMLWDEETKVIFSVVLTFWFGQRTVEKLNKNRRKTKKLFY